MSVASAPFTLKPGQFMRVLHGLLMLVGLHALPAGAQIDQPNIVYFLVDNLGK